MREVRVDIHGLIRAEAIGEDELVVRVEREFHDHLVPGKFSDPPDLLVRFGSFDGPPGALYPHDSNLIVERNRILARESFRGARWQVKIEGIEDERLCLSFHGNRLSRLIAVKRVMEPALRYLMDGKGFPMVHSTCLVQGDCGVLVAAGGGAGKTTLLLRWLPHNPGFISDDYTILAPGKALSYVTPLRIGLRNILESHSLRRIPLRDQAEIALRTGLKHLFLKKARLAFKAPVKKLFPGVKLLSEVELRAAVVLRSEGMNLSIKAMSPHDMAAALVAINREEMYRFPDYLEAYSRSFPESVAAGFFEAQRKRLLSIIGTLPCFELILPRHWKSEEWQRFKETLFPS
jgi:hypothetical protein